jgi:hypothetical protein
MFAAEVFLALSDAWVAAPMMPGSSPAARPRFAGGGWRARRARARRSVNLGERVLKGTFETIDAECRFVIRTEEWVDRDDRGRRRAFRDRRNDRRSLRE